MRDIEVFDGTEEVANDSRGYGPDAFVGWSGMFRFDYIQECRGGILTHQVLLAHVESIMRPTIRLILDCLLEITRP
jgi:hypothetical protein